MNIEIECTECGRQQQWWAGDGLPPGWIALPLAFVGEPVGYRAPDGREYTATEVGNAEQRPHALLCPICSGS